MNDRHVEAVFEDVAYILRGLYKRNCKQVVQKWTRIRCRDYQDVLVTLRSVLWHVCPVSEPQELRFEDTPEFQAVAEIIEHSHLNQVIERDDRQQCYRLRPDLPARVRNRIGEIFVQNCRPGVSVNYHNVDLDVLTWWAARERDVHNDTGHA